MRDDGSADVSSRISLRSIRATLLACCHSLPCDVDQIDHAIVCSIEPSSAINVSSSSECRRSKRSRM